MRKREKRVEIGEKTVEIGRKREMKKGRERKRNVGGQMLFDSFRQS